MRIIIPMLGRGSRFIAEGVREPKPLIKIRGRYMFEWALDPIRSLDVEKNAVFIISKQHDQDWGLKKIITSVVGKTATIKVVSATPQGAAKTVLLLKKEINSSKELIVYNCDQFFTFDIKKALKKLSPEVSGFIPYFHATHPKWSYLDVDEQGTVKLTAEKEIISNKATVGLYYFRHGSDFVWAAQQMIAKNKMVNGEYYVCPVYNELIEKGKVIKAAQVREMWSFGTPQDVEKFDRYYKGDL